LFDDSPLSSVMSPLAPARIATSGPAPPMPPPVPTKSRFSSAVGDERAPSRWPAISQSTLPVAGSYERVVLPETTSSVRSLFFQTSGVHQFDLASRATRHSSS